MTYRTRYYTTLQPVAVLDVLMADENNPRSLDFQLAHLVDLYQGLPRHLADDLEAMRDALAMLRSFDLRTISHSLPGDPARTTRLRGSRRGSKLSLKVWNDCCHHGQITYRAGISATLAPCRSA